MERLPRIFELSVLLGRSPSKGDALSAVHMQEAGGLTVEMQEFFQGLDESEAACTLYIHPYMHVVAICISTDATCVVLAACQTAGRTMQEYLA